MNGAHWHLVVNHLPIVFPIVGILVMIGAYLAKSETVKRTALMIFVMGAITAFSAMSTGEGAEEVVEHLSGVSEASIETHEELAEVFALLTYVLGALSLIGLWASFKQKRIAALIYIVCLVLSLVVVFYAKETGTSGGEIRHPEIKTGYVAPTAEHTEDHESDND